MALLRLFLPLPLGLILATVGLPAVGSDVQRATAVAEDHARESASAIVSDLATLGRYPNDGRVPADIDRLADVLVDLFSAREFEAAKLAVAGANPAVWARRDSPGAARTVTFYIHYDGQPVEPENWASPPFEPTLRDGKLEQGARVIDLDSKPVHPDWRLYGRGTSDDRAPIVALLHAIDALDAAGITPDINIQVFLEGEEEMGSPNLEAILEAHADRLQSDLWLFFDGPQRQDGRPSVTLGVRGTTGFDLTLFGSDGPLHSGHYGNFAPNPIQRLMALLGTMRSSDGTVTIPGFYDEVLPLGLAAEALLAADSNRNEQVMDLIGIAGIEDPETKLEAAILRPALNFVGIQSGTVGAARRNAIPNRAEAAVGIRLVAGQTPEHLREVVIAHIEAQGYTVLDRDPTPQERRSLDRIARVDWSKEGYPASRTPPDAPVALALRSVMGELHGDNLVTVVTMGGSLPLSVIERSLDTPVIIVPIANSDNNQHAPNENIRVGNLLDAVRVYGGLLGGLGAAMDQAFAGQ